MGSSRKGLGPSGKSMNTATEILGYGGGYGSSETALGQFKEKTQTTGDLQRQYQMGKTMASMAYQNPENVGLERRQVQSALVDPTMASAKSGAGAVATEEADLYQRALEDIQTQQGIVQADRKAMAGKIGAGAQVGASLIKMFSDENLKRDIMEVTDFTKQTLGYLKPYLFHYDKSVGIPGQMIGIMAQDLEKSSIGKTIVIEEEGKKAVDVQKAMSFILASLADINQRLEKAGV